MNCIISFIEHGHFIWQLVVFSIPIIIFFVFLFFLIRYFIRYSKQIGIVKELQTQLNKYQDATFTQKDIREYFPVREGNKITLIQFDEIVDFSASNNFIFLTDTAGKDYLVDSNLTDLEGKLSKNFIRVHKSTIVNSKLISEVKKLANGRYDLVMKCNKERIIQCSKNYNDKIKSIIDFN